MASTGAAAFNKHFKGRGDILTVMKKDSPKYDVSAPNKIVGRIEKGEMIMFKEIVSYEAKPAVILDSGELVRVAFNSIMKPGSVGRIDLKPQAFGIEELKYSLSAYVKLILEQIEERKDLIGELKLFLTELTLQTHKSGSVNKIKEAYDRGFPINEINKDFGEVLGPIVILGRQKLLKQKKINFDASSRIFVPSRPNEPLMDYGIIHKGKTFIISAKSGTTTNTVKAADIIMLLQKDKQVFNKHKNTLQFKVLEAISNGSTVGGPVLAGSVLAKKYREFQGLTVKGSQSITKREYNRIEFENFIQNNKLMKGKNPPTALELAYAIEKLIVNVSRHKLDFTDIFSDAVHGQVTYVKFELDATGTPKWSVSMSEDFSKKRVVLRTKNGNTRSADKIGIQP